MKTLVIPFFNGVEIHKDKDGRISLTDLWKAAGSDRSKRPVIWIDQDQAKGFLKATCRILKVTQDDLLKTTKGRKGGTFGHDQVALEYAQYLSPELAVTVNQVFFERIEEEKNPELAINRAMGSWERKGKTSGWISKRIQSIATRKEFTKTLGSAGVVRDGFRDCTNAIYTPLFGGKASTVREKYNMPEKANTREHMSEIQLAAVELAEMISAQNIQKKGLFGNDACILECNTTSRIIASSVSQALKIAA